ncbi:MAG: type I-E CRISPR-associated protein Cse1/CasA [Kiritimatiellae bacterium]|nr:type I-E CRISPR-associated protein Cse1/CasA [Kiritimatiellia bacterium]
MNLVNDPWIPVVMRDGAPGRVSLRDVFEKGEDIADLAANPCQRIALMRLLICVAQAALDGPNDEDDWSMCKPRIAPAALAYLDRWKDRFNLFGEHAFLQVDGLGTTINSLADKLDLSLASGNNPTLFDHESSPQGRIQAGALLALNLLVYQMFSCGGTFSATVWDNIPTPPNGVRRSPCVEEAMAHTLLRGHNIFETIHLNLITEAQITSLPNMKRGRPCWEETCLDRESSEKQTSSYLGRLVPMSRAIRLFENSSSIVLGEAMRYPQLPEQRDPFGTVYDTGKARLGKSTNLTYLSVNPEAAAWRELASVLSLQALDSSLGTVGAFNLQHLRTIQAREFDVWIGGLSLNQAKVIDMCEWSFRLSSSLLDTLVLNRYRKGVEWANTAKQTLADAIKRFAAAQKAESGIWRQQAVGLFWSYLDAESLILQSCVADDGRLFQTWMPIIHSALLAAYDRTCPHETPRQIQAYAQGLKVLQAWKKERDRHGT